MAERHARCLVCLRPLGGGGDGESHRRCRKRLFGRPDPPEIEIDPASLHLLGQEMAGKVTISGVQRKISLGFEGAALRVRSASQRFILKPPDGAFPHLPENEHVTMLLAERVGISVAPSGLVRLHDGSLAFLTRRFDRTDDGRRLAMEDFCQLLELAPGDKYDGSYERCAKVVERFSDAPLIDLRNLFRLLLFAWWTNNGDLHLKNLALLTGVPGRPRLSPAYDLLNTDLPVPGDPLALTLAGKRDRLRARDWLELAERCHLDARVVGDECVRFLRTAKEGFGLIRDSFLPAPLQLRYAERLLARTEDLLQLLEATRSADSARTSKPGAREPTPQSVARTIRLLEREFTRRGVELREGPLSAALGELEWLALEERPFFDAGGVAIRSAERFRSSLASLTRLERLRRALMRLSKTSGVADKLRHLRNLRVPGFAAGLDQAWALIFELELAALLAASFWTVELREAEGQPDLVVRDAYGEELVVECKRPLKLASIARNVVDAAQQLAAAKRLGIVAVDLSACCAPIADVSGAPSSAAALRDALSRDLADLRADIDRALSPFACDLGRLGPGVAGVLFVATPWVLETVPESGYGWIDARTTTHRHPTPGVEGADDLLRFLEGVVAAGQAELATID